jgi:integrase
VRIRQPDGTYKSVQRNESSKRITKTEARELLNERLAEFGTRPQFFGRDLSLTDVRDIAITKYETRGYKSVDKVKIAFKRASDFFEQAGPVRAKDLTEEDFDLFVAQRKRDGASLATIRNELAVIRRGFVIAAKKGRFVPPNFPELPMPDNARQVFFEYATFAAIRAGLRPYQQPMVTWEFYTGWRISEVLELTHTQHIDWAAELAFLDPFATKGKDRRIFPWGKIPELREMMLAQREWIREVEVEREMVIPWLFPRPNGKKASRWVLRRTWKEACKTAGVPGARVHDFRRTACRNIVRAGNTLDDAMKLVGWKRRATAERYNITDIRDREEAAVRLAGFVELQKQEKPTIVPITPPQVN